MEHSTRCSKSVNNSIEHGNNDLEHEFMLIDELGDKYETNFDSESDEISILSASIQENSNNSIVDDPSTLHNIKYDKIDIICEKFKYEFLRSLDNQSVDEFYQICKKGMHNLVFDDLKGILLKVFPKSRNNRISRPAGFLKTEEFSIPIRINLNTNSSLSEFDRNYKTSSNLTEPITDSTTALDASNCAYGIGDAFMKSSEEILEVIASKIEDFKTSGMNPRRWSDVIGSIPVKCPKSEKAKFYEPILKIIRERIIFWTKDPHFLAASNEEKLFKIMTCVFGDEYKVYLTAFKKLPTEFGSVSMTWSLLASKSLNHLRKRMPIWNELKRILLYFNLISVDRKNSVIRRI